MRLQIEKNLSAPASGRLLDAELMVGDGFDVCPSAMPRFIEFFAERGAANFVLGEMRHFGAAEHKLLGIGNRKNFREPRVEQRFRVRAGCAHFAPLALFDPGEFAGQRHHRKRRVRKQFFPRRAVRDESHIGRMFDDFKWTAHAVILSHSAGVTCRHTKA